MKTIKKLVLVSTLIITSGSLFAASSNDSSNVYVDQQEVFNETMYFGEDVEIAVNANKTLQNSAIAFKKIMQDPDTNIPPSLITQAEGIVIIPKAFKLALCTAGGQGGRGIAMIRLDDGSWSNPFFVTLGEASVGFQLGVQKSDIVLLFKNRDDIISIEEADVMLGCGIVAAAGHASKEAATATGVDFEEEIYLYQRSKGLFAGVNLNGGVLAYNKSYNETLYAMNEVTPDDIFNRMKAPYNYRVYDLIETLNMYSK